MAFEARSLSEEALRESLMILLYFFLGSEVVSVFVFPSMGEGSASAAPVRPIERGERRRFERVQRSRQCRPNPKPQMYIGAVLDQLFNFLNAQQVKESSTSTVWGDDQSWICLD